MDTSPCYSRKGERIKCPANLKMETGLTAVYCLNVQAGCQVGLLSQSRRVSKHLRKKHLGQVIDIYGGEGGGRESSESGPAVRPGLAWNLRMAGKQVFRRLAPGCS